MGRGPLGGGGGCVVLCLLVLDSHLGGVPALYCFPQLIKHAFFINKYQVINEKFFFYSAKLSARMTISVFL